MNNVLSLPYLSNVYPSPPISDPSLSRQYDFANDRDGFYDPPLSGEMLDNEFDGLDDRDKNMRCRSSNRIKFVVN
jgi:hypothetical protein